jgi:hypothetical protein
MKSFIGNTGKWFCLGCSLASLSFALFGCYRAIAVVRDAERTIPVGSHVHLDVLVGGELAGAVFTILVCFVLSAISITIRPKQWSVWVVAIVSLVVAASAIPIGDQMISYAIQKCHWVDDG